MRKSGRKAQYPNTRVRSGTVTVVTAVILALTALAGLYADYLRYCETAAVIARTERLFAAHFIDVGQGDACLLVTPENDTMLVDCGTTDSSAYLVKYLKDAGIERLTYLLLTHPHEDHYGGAEAVIKAFPVENLVILDEFAETYPYDRFIYMVENNAFGEDSEVILAARDDLFSFGSAASFYIFAPEKADFDDYNESSLALKLIFGNTSFLFTGDAEKGSERAMLAAGYDVSADVFSAGHHGSATSNTASFVQAVSPDYAVISCGKNNSYGHPHQKTLQTFADNGVTVLRTDESGDIVLVSDGERVLPLAELPDDGAAKEEKGFFRYLGERVGELAEKIGLFEAA